MAGLQGLDGELAVYAYDVPADIVVGNVVVSAGLSTRESPSTAGTSSRIGGATARRGRNCSTMSRSGTICSSTSPTPVPDASPPTGTKIFADAARAFAVIERDAFVGGPLYDAPIRCWDDLSRYVDPGVYVEDLPRDSGDAADCLGGEFVIAVRDHIDTMLHQRDRPLSVDEAEAAGFGGTLRDGSEPHTWASLTPRQRAAAGLHPASTIGPVEPHDN